MSSVAELRVEVGIESYPDGAGEDFKGLARRKRKREALQGGRGPGR